MDTAGHFSGCFNDTNVSDLCKLINPDAMMDQLFITDMEIYRFINFLKNRYNEDGENRFEKSRIVITSDHGMSSMKGHIHAVDIRKALNDEHIQIRANTKWLPFGYRDDGQYEWCFSEQTHSYIFCKENEQEDIVKVLKKLSHIDIKLIFDKNGQVHNKMWKGDYEDVVWPRIMVFLKPNYMTPSYGDQLPSLLSDHPHISSVIAKILDIPTAPGMHGTASEQNVPLIFVSPGEEEIPRDKVVKIEVSVLDIAPSIAYLQWKKIPSSFEGRSLFPVIEERAKAKRVESPTRAE
jgi:arylsulfatase A-like enzyme